MTTNTYKNSGVLWTFVIVVLLLVFTVYIYYPGFLSIDSEYQLHQARMFKFSDWHPPMMSFVWFLLNHIYDGPASMLVFHNLLFWSALFLFSLWLFPTSNLYRVIFIVIFAFLPSVYRQLGGIWKDVSLSMSLFLVSVLLLYVQDCHEKWVRSLLFGLILLFLFYGFSVRLNSAPGVIVMCLWIVDILFTNVKFVQKIVLGLILFLIMAGMNNIFVYSLLHANRIYPYQQVEIHDLAAISIANNKVLFPQYLINAHNLTIAKIIDKYTPANVGSFIFGDKLTPLTDNANDIKQLNKVWFDNVKKNPLIYLRHRALCYGDLLLSCTTYLGDVCTEPYGITFHPTFFYNLYCKIMALDSMQLLLTGWVYVLNCLFAIGAAWLLRKRLEHWKAILYIATSGFLYNACQFIYTPACEFRYVYWTVIASLMALVIFAHDVMHSEK